MLGLLKSRRGPVGNPIWDSNVRVDPLAYGLLLTFMRSPSPRASQLTSATLALLDVSQTNFFVSANIAAQMCYAALGAAGKTNRTSAPFLPFDDALS